MKSLSFNRTIVLVFSLLLAITIARGFYVFYWTKNYDYLVETKCDPTNETCFHRDCANDPANCPPDNLNDYRQFYIKAYDFARCGTTPCGQLCENQPGLCREVKCGDDSGDTCSSVTQANTTSSPQ